MPEHRLAFVAMKFAGTPLQDRRYQKIKETLQDAGYSPLRADEIKTSGPVVEEVCRLLRDADLVVIDSTGDSHSVSYEIGFCHGIARSPDRTILLREGSDIPFNYRHFRHHTYSSVRGISNVLRNALGLPRALREEDYGFVASFSATTDTTIEESILADSLLKALSQVRFSGCLEVLIDDGYPTGESAGEGFHRVVVRTIPSPSGERILRVGLLVQLFGKKTTPEFQWWDKFSDIFGGLVQTFHKGITFERRLSEMGSVRSIRPDLTFRCAFITQMGQPKRMLKLMSTDSENLFVKTVTNGTGTKTPS